ncbi:MAG TPA: efflux RND transporter periplasmic adaptor subunit [Burkholderiales bacterium]|nr:efflux RND transporter periplasmic adaptor subunit [Burkholderiales bacterium]
MKSRNLIFALVAATLIGAAGYGIYRIGMDRGMKMAGPASTAAPGSDAAGRKVLYWHDPMVPGQKFDKPGKSPYMDMQLVPVYADGQADESKVTISPRMQQNLGVRTAEVTKGILAASVEAVGTVAYNERDLALVQARANGFVEKLHVRAPLDAVRKGQPLAELYVPEWVTAQEEYLSVRRMSGTRLDALVDGARQRMRLAGMSDDQIRLVESTGKVHGRLALHAPISGVVTELGAREGMTVATGATLFRINGVETVWVNAEVREAQASEVRPGNPVEARSPALPGTTFKGRVNAILPEVNPATRTLKARVELANPGGKLVPGMFVTVAFASAARKEALLVPTEAVIRTGSRSIVIVADGAGKFVPVDVEIGTESEGRSEIRNGLEAGQKVVVSGQFLIDSEASLRGTAARMGDAPDLDGGTTGAPTHRGEGKIERIGKDEVTLSHGPISSLHWGPMTMGFRLPAGGLPANLAVGDAVTFEFRESGGGMFEITSISRTAPARPIGGDKDKEPK